MNMPAFRRQWTVDDLQDLPDDGQRYEVIDGELFVTPAPSFAHQRAPGILCGSSGSRLARAAPLVIDVAAYFAEVLDA